MGKKKKKKKAIKIITVKLTCKLVSPVIHLEFFIIVYWSFSRIQCVEFTLKIVKFFFVVQFLVDEEQEQCYPCIFMQR